MRLTRRIEESTWERGKTEEKNMGWAPERKFEKREKAKNLLR